MAGKLPPLREVERISTSVWRILGGNPGKFTLQGTNTYIISPPDSVHRVLIDTGEGSAFPSWSSALRRYLSSESTRLGRTVYVTQCVLTHWHHDHVGGLNELRKICAEREHGGGEEVKPGYKLRVWKFPLRDDDDSHGTKRQTQLLSSANDDQDPGRLYEVKDGQILEVGENATKIRIKVIHTPGHTADHIALLVVSSLADNSEVGTIFTGDAVLGHGTAVFEDLATYMASLEKIKRALDKVAEGLPEGINALRGFPGHGDVIPDAVAKIREYIAHRAMRERQILDVLATAPPANDRGGKDGLRGWTSMQIVKVVYADVPESLHLAAERGVVQVLEKLENEGRVKRADDQGKVTWCLKSNDEHQLGRTEQGRSTL